ncbi:MAG: hypothetical protein ACTHK3_06385 [Solirubrobacterales bacterium]
MSVDSGALATGRPRLGPARLPSPTLRFRVRLRRHKLERQLAAGADPNATDELRERARQLVAEESRRSIAASLRRFLEDASSRPRPFSSRVPIARNAIRDSRGDIEGIIERLDTRNYLCPQGVAQLSLLLREGTSPLFGSATPSRQLRWSLLAAVDGLEGGPVLVA